MPRPNILLITADQQRFDTVGSRAPSFMRTPHYDQLANEGTSFTAAYADCPLCVPSRTSIMTGKYGFNHGMLGNGPTVEVMGRDDTLPAFLGELGYQTAAIGKMHFGPQRARHGFDEMILPQDYYREMHRQGYDLQPMRHGLGQNELYPGMATVPEAKTLTSWTAEQCVEYILERRDPTAPFFLWCSFSKPHPPFDPPEPYYSMYRNSAIPAPVVGDWVDADDCPAAFSRFNQQQGYDRLTPEVIREARAAYYGLITQNDYNMGRIFAALQDVNLFRETLIIYTSDHGEYLGDHRAGAKTFFHEPSAHIPFVLRLPQSWEHRQSGAQVDSLVSLADILPTLVAAAGGTPPAGVDGQNLVALARDELADPRQYLEGMFPEDGQGFEYYGITDGHWKYIWYPEGSAEQLFDLHRDPDELQNLAGLPEYRQAQARLKEELVARHTARQSPAVQDGKLVATPPRGDSVTERRNNGWPGYHTDYLDADVKH